MNGRPDDYSTNLTLLVLNAFSCVTPHRIARYSAASFPKLSPSLWVGSHELIETLADVMLFRGILEDIRSDKAPEFIANDLRRRLAKLGTGTLYSEPGSPRDKAIARASSES